MAKKGAGTVLLGGILALALAYGTDDSGSESAPDSNQAVTNTFASQVAASRAAALRGDLVSVAQQLGMTAGPRGHKHNVNCAAFATGQVREYLLHTPCKSMDRLLFTIRDAGGGSIAVAVAWVDMATPAQARELR